MSSCSNEALNSALAVLDAIERLSVEKRTMMDGTDNLFSNFWRYSNVAGVASRSLPSETYNRGFTT